MQEHPITIVSGLPRSGTSMMMQMIHAGGMPALTDGQRVSDSDNPRGYFEYEAVKKTKDDPSWLAEAPGKVVKMVHLLLLALPPGYRYRVVMMRRDLDEVLRSQAAMLERQGRTGATLAPDVLSKTFAKQMSMVKQVIETRPAFTSIDINYADVVAHPHESAKRISEFLGGLDTEAMVAAVDPTLYRQKNSP